MNQKNNFIPAYMQRLNELKSNVHQQVDIKSTTVASSFKSEAALQEIKQKTMLEQRVMDNIMNKVILDNQPSLTQSSQPLIINQPVVIEPVLPKILYQSKPSPWLPDHELQSFLSLFKK